MADRDILLSDPVSFLPSSLGDCAKEILQIEVDTIREHCDSEIEVVFFSAVAVWSITLSRTTSHPVCIRLEGDDEFTSWRENRGEDWSHAGWTSWTGFLQHERPIAGQSCRVDCEFRTLSDNFRPIVVEIDGFKWHGNKDSFIRDRTRSRCLTMSGSSVLRYAGSEVWKDPLFHAKELVSFLTSLSNGPIGRQLEEERTRKLHLEMYGESP